MTGRPRRAILVGLALAAMVTAANPQLLQSRSDEGQRPASPADWAQWRESFLQDENGNVPPDGLLRAKTQMDAMRAAQLAGPMAGGIGRGTWVNIGPGNIGGSIRAIVIDPASPDTIFIGSVSGGIWKTTNSGTSWSVVDDFMTNLAVTSIVMDPTSPAGNRTYYAATGEGFINIGALQGAGIFKSSDNGVTWTQLASTNTSNFYFVNRLAISSTGVLLAATRTGIFRTADGGTTFLPTTGIAAGVSDLNSGMLDVEFNPVDPLQAVAASFGGAAWYATDGGASWTKATGLPGALEDWGVARVELAIAPSAPSTVYASEDSVVGDVMSGFTVLGGTLYRSLDGGHTYSILIDGAVDANDPLALRGFDENLLWVNPTNASDVVWGGLDLWRSTNVGVTPLFRLSRWQDQVVSGSTTAPTSVHAGHHIAVERPGFGASNHTVFFGNDGGIYKAADLDAIVCGVPCTTGWSELNNGLAITQFYGGAGHAGTGRVVGGTPDNGSLFFDPATASASENWFPTFGADGGYSAYDPTDSNVFYGESVNLQIHRSTGAPGPSSSQYIANASAPNGLLDAGSPTAAEIVAPFILDPSNPNTLLAGSSKLWRSTNAKAPTPSFELIKNNETGGTTSRHITAIAVAPSDSDQVWVGMRDGRVFRTTSGTAAAATVLASWTAVDNNDTLVGPNPFPNRRITRITVHPTDPNIVFVTLGGFSGDNIYKTVNGGAAWNDFTGGTAGSPGALPDVPVRDVVFHPTLATNRVYAATEIGVFASDDGGATWKVSPSGDGPSNVSVDQLFFLNTDLYAATHGRGIFKTSTTGPLGPSFVGGIPNITTTPGVAGSSNFTITDPDTPLTSLMLSGSSSNQAVVPNAAIGFGGSAGSRSVTVTPVAGVAGSAVVTVTVSDGIDTASTTLTVTAVALPPTISSIPNITTSAGIGGSSNFTVADADTALSSLVIAGSSSNTAVVPNASIQFSGLGANRTVTVTPASGATGSATITVTVSDLISTASATFTVTIVALPPTISAIPAQSVVAGASITANFTIGDPDTAAASLLLTGSSSNQSVVPDTAIQFFGSGTNRAVTVTTPAIVSGAVTITLTVADPQSNSASTSFVLNIQPLPLVGAPQNFQVVAYNGNNVTFGWTLGAGQLAPTGHLLEGGVNAGDVMASIPTSSAAPTFTIAAPNGAFYVRLKTLSGANVSANSNEIRIFVNVPPPPSAPANLLGMVNGGFLALSWKNTTAGGAPTLIRLSVTGSLAVTLDLPGSAESFNYSGVPPGAYNFTVTAINATGASAPSAPVSLSFPGACSGPPQAPASFQAVKSGNLITVSWDTPAAGPALTGYTLNVTGSFVGSFATTARTMSGVVGPGSYTIGVVANNPCGTGPSAPAVTVTIP